jgi:hypothetical protein
LRGILFWQKTGVAEERQDASADGLQHGKSHDRENADNQGEDAVD